MKALREAREGRGSTWRERLGGILPGGRAVRSMLIAARMKRFDASRVVVSEDVTAFWQQGEAKFYTEEAIRSRTTIRHDPHCLEVLHLWWQSASLPCHPATARHLPTHDRPT